VQKAVERDWELAIDPDTVRLFILKAKAISADLKSDYQDGGEHAIELDDQTHDGHHHDFLAEEESEDLTAEELRELIDDLNVDEAADLVALAWVGRGDFDAAEWAEAVAAARERGTRRVATYLLGLPMLADHWEAGLDALGA
jgi:hypothetical protein